MAEINNPVASPAVDATPKKKRRGINNETRSTSNLKFTEADAIHGGLFVGIIESVRCGYANIGSDSTGMGSFAGHSIPRFEMHLTSAHKNVNERRHITLTLNPVESSVDTYENGEKSWQVNRVTSYLKHILEVFYLNGRELTDEEIDALTLSYDDCDEEGNYVSVEVEDVIKGWQVLFENTAAMLNGTFGKDSTNKPCYKDANGNPLRTFMKLIRHIKSGRGANAKWSNVSNGDLSFPAFVGEGVFEKMKGADAVPVILKLNPLTESIKPMQIAEAKAPNMPGNIPGGMPGMGGIAVSPYGSDYNANAASSAAGEEMPF